MAQEFRAIAEYTRRGSSTGTRLLLMGR